MKEASNEDLIRKYNSEYFVSNVEKPIVVEHL